MIEPENKTELPEETPIVDTQNGRHQVFTAHKGVVIGVIIVFLALLFFYILPEEADIAPERVVIPVPAEKSVPLTDDVDLPAESPSEDFPAINEVTP